MAKGNHQRLGELLVDQGIISNLQLAVALAAQKTLQCRLGEVIVERGFADEEQIAKCLAEQYGYEYTDLHGVQPESSALDLVDAEIAVQAEILPVRVESGVLHCVSADPLDVLATDAIRHASGVRIEMMIAPRSSLLSAIRRWYRLDAEGAPPTAAGMRTPPERFSRVWPRFATADGMLADAYDNTLGREVSLLFGQALADEGSEAFTRIRSFAGCNGSGLLRIYDWFDFEGCGWVVMEPVRGESVANIVRTRGNRTPAQAAAIVSQLAVGVDQLVQAGQGATVIGPANVLVGRGGVCCIAPLEAIGSEFRLPPGVATNHELSEHVYALGALLHFLLTGRAPAKASAHMPTEAALSGLFESEGIWIPSAMVEILFRCLCADPPVGYSSTLQLKLALESCSWRCATTQVTSPAEVGRDREQLLDSLEEGPATARRRGFLSFLFRKSA
ncbi:MAG: hypothetical protein HND42_11040 [Armatimonadetes bacterium]|nr:hypothetical protein [Armatimonadota bacterium]NOG93764.1 hypothetical protein [Armatimonadota bacterium]